MTRPLENKTALVTGASRGIGAAIARTLAARGAHVIVHYGRSRDEAEALAADIEAQGGSAETIGADLEPTDGVTTLIAATETALGERRLDILVNNAGIAEYVGALDVDAATVDRLFAVNVRAPLLIAAGLAPRVADGGSIVFTSSIVGKTYFPGIAPYAMTKGAIDTLVVHLAAELGPRGIRVNGVAPGAIATDMSAWLDTDEGKANAYAMQALQRVGQPEDIAGVVAFLAGAEANWVTGQVIDTSGGSKL